MQNPSEVSHRGNIFFACLLFGLFLMIPAVWIHDALMERIATRGEPPAKWFRDITGLLFAITPAFLLGLASVRFLEKRYPDSPPGKIPEPHERPSANRR